MSFIQKYCAVGAIVITYVVSTSCNLYAGDFAAQGTEASPLQNYVNEAVRAALHQFGQVKSRARVLRNTVANSMPERLCRYAQVPADSFGLLRPGVILSEQTVRNLQQAYQTFKAQFSALLQKTKKRLCNLTIAQSRVQAAEKKASVLQQKVVELESLVDDLISTQERTVQSSCNHKCTAVRQELQEVQQRLRNAGRVGNQMQQDYAALQQRCTDAQVRIGQQGEALARYERESAHYKRSLEEQQRLCQQVEQRNQRILQEQAESEMGKSQEIKALQLRFDKLIRAEQNKAKKLETFVLKQSQENKRLQDMFQEMHVNQYDIQSAQDSQVVAQLQEELASKSSELEALRVRVQELESASSRSIPIPPAAPPMPGYNAADAANASEPPVPPVPGSSAMSSNNIPVPPAPVVLSNVVRPESQEREALFAEIRRGTTLKKTESRESQRVIVEPGSFAEALDERFKLAHAHDDDSDDEDLDDEWI